MDAQSSRLLMRCVVGARPLLVSHARLVDLSCCRLTSRRSQPPLALSVPLSRFTPRVGGGSAFFVRHRKIYELTSVLVDGDMLLAGEADVLGRAAGDTCRTSDFCRLASPTGWPLDFGGGGGSFAGFQSCIFDRDALERWQAINGFDTDIGFLSDDGYLAHRVCRLHCVGVFQTKKGKPVTTMPNQIR